MVRVKTKNAFWVLRLRLCCHGSELLTVMCVALRLHAVLVCELKLVQVQLAPADERTLHNTVLDATGLRHGTDGTHSPESK